MKFGEVIEILSDGKHRAYRKGWHGKNMFIYIEGGKIIPYDKLREPQKSWLGKDMEVAPHFNLYVDNVVVTGWLASQTDMLADDWKILSEE